MENIISYLKWRGDIDFCERSFCNVDNLVLAELSYFDFSGIVPADEHSVLVSDIAEEMCQKNNHLILPIYRQTSYQHL